MKRYLRWWLLPIGLSAFLFLLSIITFWWGRQLWQTGQRLQGELVSAQAAWNGKNLKLAQGHLQKAERDLSALENTYGRMKFWSYVPVAKNYYRDGEHVLRAGKAGIEAGQLLLKSVEPYQDFLGFGTAKKGDGAKTAADRIEFLVETISSLKPQLAKLSQELATLNNNLAAIDARRYPQEWRGRTIRSKIINYQGMARELARLGKDGQPLIEKASWLLGKDKSRQYLVIFQNDGELRPTGGFWTAYGLFQVSKGKIKPVFSSDIYTLDSDFNSPLAPPPMLARYLKVSRWHLRDMNVSPDFAVSIKQFLKYYQPLSGRRRIDGVVAVDTQVLVDLLKVLGRIGVSGWGNFSAKPDNRCFGCPQVVYQLEMLADKPRSTLVANRKGFLGPVLHSLLANIIGAPRQQVSSLAKVIWSNLEEKHILLYFPDEKMEKAISSLGFAGRITSMGDDYFQLNDSNLGGAKANLFINQKIETNYLYKQGKVFKKVTVTYTNPAPASNCNLEKGDLCLNGAYRDWFRFYLPKGTKLIKLTGSEIKPTISEELGKTVVSGFFGNKNPLYPKSRLILTAEFELPFSKRDFRLWRQKQPGKKEVQEIIKANGKSIYSQQLRRDRLIRIKF